jgi:ech hydrogenase subunit D
MSETQFIEAIEVSALVERTTQYRKDGWRLVQISATRLSEQVQVTYSFDRHSLLANLRLHLPADAARLPSISSVFWCAFPYENELHDLFNVAVEGIAVDFKGNFYNTAVKFPFAAATAPAVSKSPPTPTPTTKHAPAAAS